MGKGGSAGTSGGGLASAESLSRAGIDTTMSPDALKRAWKGVFGKDLQSVDEIRNLVGVRSSDLGKDGVITVRGNAILGFKVSAQSPHMLIERTFRPGSVKHDVFFLAPELQGKGVGTRVLKTSVAQYQRLGVKKVSLDAAEVGRYVWPKMGFRVDSEYMGKYRAGFTKFLSDRGYEPSGRIHSVKQIADTVIGGRKLGKEYLLSSESPTLTRMTARVSRLARELK